MGARSTRYLESRQSKAVVVCTCTSLAVRNQPRVTRENATRHRQAEPRKGERHLTRVTVQEHSDYTVPYRVVTKPAARPRSQWGLTARRVCRLSSPALGLPSPALTFCVALLSSSPLLLLQSVVSRWSPTASSNCVSRLHLLSFPLLCSCCSWHVPGVVFF